MAAIAITLLSMVPVEVSAETITLTTQEWKPYQTVVNGRVEGLAVAAVKCVIEKMGHTPEITVLPWVRAQKWVADGSANGFFAASKNADRDAFAEMSQPFISQIWRWYTLAETPADVTSKTAKTGALAGSAMQKWLDDNGYVGSLQIRTTDALVKMLQMGRIEAVLANAIVFTEALKSAGVAESMFKWMHHSERPLGVYFGKTFLAAHPGFLDGFNAQIKACP